MGIKERRETLIIAESQSSNHGITIIKQANFSKKGVFKNESLKDEHHGVISSGLRKKYSLIPKQGGSAERCHGGGTKARISTRNTA